MKKTEQIAINEEVKVYLAKLNTEIKTAHEIGRLRSCKATVYETPNFYILCSYNITVACIDKRTDTLVDFLRLVYGYTPTSGKHIGMFSKDYGRCVWGLRKHIEIL